MYKFDYTNYVICKYYILITFKDFPTSLIIMWGVEIMTWTCLDNMVFSQNNVFKSFWIFN